MAERILPYEKPRTMDNVGRHFAPWKLWENFVPPPSPLTTPTVNLCPYFPHLRKKITTSPLTYPGILHPPLGYRWVERKVERVSLVEDRLVWLKEGVLECIHFSDRQVLWRYNPPVSLRIADIAVVKDRVFFLAYQQLGPSARRIRVIALRLNSGSQLWERSLYGPLLPLCC
ncbi:MAG: hypothetical protein RMK30_07005 [Anaerolineae bacterium]|nr:hypothetical protein [Anaerolineae bacterium]